MGCNGLTNLLVDRNLVHAGDRLEGLGLLGRQTLEGVRRLEDPAVISSNRGRTIPACPSWIAPSMSRSWRVVDASFTPLT